MIACGMPWANFSFCMLVSRSLFVMILGSESGSLELQKQAFGVRGIVKTHFHRCLNSVDFRINFDVFFNDPGVAFSVI